MSALRLRANYHSKPDADPTGWWSKTYDAEGALRRSLELPLPQLREWIAAGVASRTAPLTCLRFDLERENESEWLPLVRWLKSAQGKRFPHCPSGIQVARVRPHYDDTWRVEGGYADLHVFHGVQRVVDWVPLDDLASLDPRWRLVLEQTSCGPNGPLPPAERPRGIEWSNDFALVP